MGINSTERDHIKTGKRDRVDVLYLDNLRDDFKRIVYRCRQERRESEIVVVLPFFNPIKPYKKESPKYDKSSLVVKETNPIVV